MSDKKQKLMGLWKTAEAAIDAVMSELGPEQECSTTVCPMRDGFGECSVSDCDNREPLTVPEEQESPGYGQALKEKLEQARLDQRWVTVEYSDGCAHTGTIKVVCSAFAEDDGMQHVVFDDGCTVLLFFIGSVEVGEVIDEPDEHDIASERWMVYKGVCGVEIRQKCDGHAPSLALTRHGDLVGHAKLLTTDAQTELMAAAPELADMLRNLLQTGEVFRAADDVVLDNFVLRAILKLRELGVPNVAQWYEGKGSDKTEDR